MIMVTKNFSYKELVHSDTADKEMIFNEPGYQEMFNLARLCNKVLQPLRNQLAKPINITSGYRSPMLNSEVGGSETSAHMYGAAVDCTSPGKVGIDFEGKHYTVTANFAIFYYGLLNPYVDQVIHEYGEYGHPEWVHIGITKEVDKISRWQALRAVRERGYIPVYQKELLDMIKSSQSIALSF